MSEDCVFCVIVSGDAPVHAVQEDEHTLAFLDIRPWTRGHTLVIPKVHADDLWDVPRSDALAVMGGVHRVASTLRERLEPDGLNLLQATRAVAMQTVFHLHVHVLPRYEDDGLALETIADLTRRPEADRADLAALAETIRGES